MAHGNYRHSRIEKLHSTRRHRQIAQNEDATPGLLPGDSSKVPTLPAADQPEDCDPSENLACLGHQIRQSEESINRRDETVSESVTVETVLQVVDASSHILLQSTAADFPLTISESAYGAITISDVESLAATGSFSISASVDVPLLTSPTIAPATQPTTSLVSETSSSASPTTTQSTTSTSQAPSSTLRVASPISSPVRMSTPLVAPSSSTHTSNVTPNAYNFVSNSESSSTSTPSISSSWTPDETYSSSTSYWSSESQTATATGTSSAPSTSATSGSGSGQASTSNPDTPKIVGGVVGSVAGLALLIFLLFYYLRRRGFLMGAKGHTAISDDAAAGAGIAGIGALAASGTTSREVTERPANENRFTASYFAPAFMKRWRQSTATMRTDSTVDSTSSERGFQKISGRKLPPVLTHGGDGFGGGIDDSPTVPGFPPTSPAPRPVGSPVSPAPPPSSRNGMPLDSSYTREIQEHAPPSRPGPAHIPVSNSVNVAYPITITPAHPIAEPQSAIPFIPPRPDGLGRSLHSHDGSRSSRFTEGIDM
ncbi:unnamed protein product [Penicillium olsonii]|uniref:Mid2 domain-containing protein n=1 Tax=Penicillium olsonii TaxID=99116 RepID=A0A9W4HDU0_PENOL|nr:unnamed protein product [Penicillium olsonii]CAG7979294.1 unnamed protein product [Penicillium olsonii]